MYFMKFSVLLQMVLVVSLLALTVSSYPLHVSAAALSYGAGVKPGDTVTYGNVTAFWQGNSTIPPPPFITEFLHVQSIHISVLSASGSNVSAMQTFNFNNGTTARSSLLRGSVADASGNLTFWILASGLNTGDPIYNTPAGAPRINSTDTLPFAGAFRQVIHLNFVLNGGSLQLNWAWDQATGVLLSFDSFFAPPNGGNSFFGYSIAAITSTSLWAFTPTPNFSISANPPTIILTSSFNSTLVQPSIITLTSSNFTGPVQLTVNVNPSGLPVKLGSFTLVLKLNGQNTTTLTPLATPSTPSGSYQVTVIGTAGSISHAAIITVIVPNSTIGDFGIKANPTSLTIQKSSPNDPSASSFSTVTLTSLNGFSGTVTLSSTPTGFLGETFSPSQVNLAANSSANASLVLAGGNSPPGNYFVTVTGTSGSISHSVTLTVEVVIQPDFQLFLSIPFGGNIVLAGATTSVGVQLFSNGISFFNGTVTLTGQVSPIVSNGPALSFNPTQISFTPPGTPFSQLTISTTALTPPGNYTITVTGTSGTLVHTFQLQLTVLPPPVLALSPSSGPVGTQVRVHGSGFLSPSQGPFFSPVELQITFDDQLVSFFFLQGSSFNFTFNVPDAQAGIVHQIHAKELFPSSLDVQASFLVLPEPSALTVGVSAGTIYFPGDTATIFAMTSLNGQPIIVTSLQVILVRPDGSNLTLKAILVSPGVYKASYAVPATGSIGTYAVLVKAHQTGSSDGSALVTFEIKPTWLQTNARNVITATSLVGAVGALGVMALAWRKGYFTKRKDEFPIP
jgi:hypothetical protein